MKLELKNIIMKGEGTLNFPIDTDLLHNGRNENPVSLKISRQYNGEWEFKPSIDSWIRYKDASSIITVWEAIHEKTAEVLDLMRELTKDLPRIEGIYQIAEKARQEKLAKEAAEAEKARQADKPVGMKLANEIINHMRKKAKSDGSRHNSELHIQMAERGTRKEMDLYVKFSYGGKTLFSTYQYGNIISRVKAVQKLADSSLDALKVDGVQYMDPKLAKFMMKA